MKKCFFVIFLLVSIGSCKMIESEKMADESNSSLYLSNRKPLRENPYLMLPLGAVKAGGWLNEMLLRQKNGSTGNLDELYPLVMGKNNGWLGGDGDQWERGPYWVHGLITLAYLLEDEDLINKAIPWVEWVLNSQKENGYFGPDKDYPNAPGLQRNNSADWWPRMVVLKILQQYYSATQDNRVIDFMTKYFKYQHETLPTKPLGHWTFWAKYRGGDNLMVVYWLYNITGDSFLLDLAELVHDQTFDYTHKFLETKMIQNNENIHCVNLAQGIKEPIIYFQQNPDNRYVESVKKAFSDIRMFSGQPQGMYGGDEALRNNLPTNGVELCSVVELMFSLENILAITGEVSFADHLERIAYNALPAQVTDDFMDRQYFQQANQVHVTREDRNFSLNHGGTDVCFGLLTGYPCCTSNMHQGWPIFTQNLWYATPDRGLAALLYAPSEVTALVDEDTYVRITESTNYPFEDTVRFKVTFDKDGIVEFPLSLRIPEWCNSAVIRINDSEYSKPDANQVIRIQREWKNSDVVELILPAEVKLNRWYENSVSVDLGSLNFVLNVEENRKKIINQKDPEVFGDYYIELTAASPWNYGLIDVPEKDLAQHYNIIRDNNFSDFPWNPQNSPIRIETKGKRVDNWKLYYGSAGPMPYSIQSGHKLDEGIETITLIPYGCSNLRISEFPLIGRYSTME